MKWIPIYVFYHEAHEEKLFFNSDLRALRKLRGEIFNKLPKIHMEPLVEKLNISFA